MSNLNDDLVKTCHNLINTNGGLFKSHKQKQFIQNNLFEGMIISSGRTYTTAWKDFFNFDEDGIISYERESNIKGLHTIWQRGQISKAEKSKERHEKALAKHQVLSMQLYAMYVEDSINTFGYVVDAEKVNNLYSAIQLSSLTNIMRISPQEEWNNICKEYANTYQYIDIFLEYHTKLNEFVRKYRLLALGEYKSKFQYDFLN